MRLELELEPLNHTYDEEKAVQAIQTALEEFYKSLTKKLENISVKKILKKKNPYLYRAKGIQDAARIVDSILSAYISSSEETIFGNAFFEPLAVAVSGGQKAVSEGIDITIEKENAIYSVAVKSGPSVFNGDSRKRQEQNFQSAQKRVQQAKKAFFPVVGYGYGMKKDGEKFYRELAGKNFWHWLTGDPEFYTKIIKFMGKRPDEYAEEFEKAYAKAKNRLTREFTTQYCDQDGSINWDALIRLNSG